MGAQGLNPQILKLGDFQPAVDAGLGDWKQGNKTTRLWNRDASLWTGHDEARWLGWLDIASQQLADLESVNALQRDVTRGGFDDVVVLGMGGSSLAPDVLSRTFGRRPDSPELRILDSTVPDQIATLESHLDLSKTLFVVASKSGTTAEPIAFESYFFDKVGDGSQFIAISDPGTPLEDMARSKGYRSVYPGEPTIGGRFSALSNFGMVPAAAMGLDVRRFLERAREMADACGAGVPPEDNPGVALGVALGTLARAGRDKLTLVASPELSSLGAWIEQLVAESTGKGGQGIVPVDGEPAGTRDVYGDDRVFVQLDGDDSDPPACTEGHPLIRIRVVTPEDLAQEFFRWEMATAVAGAVLGLNPFDQPDVEASKVKTRALAAHYEETGELAPGEDEDDTFPADEAIRTHLDLAEPGDYFAIHAYLEMSPENHRLLQAIRERVRDRKRVATTLGYGPRFLHSTGQLHKGGPDRGVFLQLTADSATDLHIPGQRLSFGQLNRFQARGDFEVLAERGRRVLRVHLGRDVIRGLERLRTLA